MHAVNTLGRLCICADSPEPSLLAYAKSTQIKCAGTFINLTIIYVIATFCLIFTVSQTTCLSVSSIKEVKGLP